jgi:hypothetical protein
MLSPLVPPEPFPLAPEEPTYPKERTVLRLMIRKSIPTSCLIAIVLAGSFALAQTEFSGEVVNTQKGNKTPTKVFFGKDKMRFESQASDSRGGAVVMDFTSHTFLVVMPQQHMYMEMPAEMMDKRGMYAFFRTGDVENACVDWLQMEKNKGGTCHKVGNDSVNGRSTIKYEGTNASGEGTTVWIDPKLRLPVKWQGKDSEGELRNIQEGSQPASLFEVPAGYTKMDMGGMMQRKP